MKIKKFLTEFSLSICPKTKKNQENIKTLLPSEIMKNIYVQIKSGINIMSTKIIPPNKPELNPPTLGLNKLILGKSKEDLSNMKMKIIIMKLKPISLIKLLFSIHPLMDIGLKLVL
jgi:hypothetical protein